MARPLPTLRQLGYLLALERQQNFTAAATEMLVSQSAFSDGIQELERLLDARLVERDRQHVRFTPLGTEVATRARAILAQANDLVEHVAHAAEPMTGTVRLGAIPTIAPFLLPGLVRACRKQYPKLRVALREDQTARLLEQLRNGALDFALIALPYDTHGLLVQDLFADRLLLAVPKDDTLARQPRVPVGKLETDRLLLLEEGHCLRSHTLAGCGLAERANASGFEASSLTTLVQMVEAGLGLALVPEMAVDMGLLKGGGISTCRLTDPAPLRRIALVARATTALRPEFEALAKLAQTLRPQS